MYVDICWTTGFKIKQQTEIIHNAKNNELSKVEFDSPPAVNDSSSTT